GAVTPPQVCGNVGNMEPSRSRCGRYVGSGYPSASTTSERPCAPGKLPNKLSKARFSAYTTTIVLTLSRSARVVGSLPPPCDLTMDWVSVQAHSSAPTTRPMAKHFPADRCCDMP